MPPRPRAPRPKAGATRRPRVAGLTPATQRTDGVEGTGRVRLDDARSAAFTDDPLADPAESAPAAPSPVPRGKRPAPSTGVEATQDVEDRKRRDAPERAAPSAGSTGALPKDAVPKSAPPKSAPPKSAAPKSAAPKSAAPKSAAPKSAAPKNVAPKNTAPKSAVKGDAPKSVAKDAAPKSSTPESAAKSAAPNDSGKNTAPWHATKDTAGSAAPGSAAKSTAPKAAVPTGSGPNAAAPTISSVVRRPSPRPSPASLRAQPPSTDVQDEDTRAGGAASGRASARPVGSRPPVRERSRSAPAARAAATTADSPEPPVAPTAAEDAQEVGRRGPLAVLRTHGATVLVGAFVVLTAAAVVFGILGDRLYDTPSAANTALVDVGATAEVAGQLSDALETVYSFDFTRLDENERAARDVITPEFAGEFDRLFGQVREQAPQQQAVVSATVTLSAVKEITGDHAVLVAFVDQQATRAAADDPQAQQLAAAGRLTVVGERIDGRWKIASVQPR